MFHRDTFRLIKKTYKRFLTIFMMVLIGVAFMVGLLATPVAMRNSVDDYYDEKNFMDVQLYSSYGFDDEDVKVLSEAHNVEEVFASKFIDVLGHSGEASYVTRVQELNSNLNQFELISGRMPTKEGEALALGSASFGTVFKEGDKVTLYLEDSDLSENLKNLEYTIVGTVRSPQYMASTKETSTLKNLDLSTVIYVDNDDFKDDFYKSVFVTFKDGRSLVAFTDEYKDFIETNVEDLRLVIDKQQDNRKEKIIDDIEKEIADGQKELDEKRAEAQKEIDDGFDALEDAKVQIMFGEAQVAANSKMLESAYAEIQKNEALINESRQQLADGRKMVEEQSGKPFDVAYKEAELAYNMYVTLEGVKDAVGDGTTINEAIDNNQKEVLELQAENIRLNAKIVELELMGGDQAEIDKLKLEVVSNESRIRFLNTVTVVLKAIDPDKLNMTISEILAELDKAANGSVKDSYLAMRMIIDGEKQLEQGQIQLDAAKLQYESGYSQLEAARSDLYYAKDMYDSGFAELVKGQQTLDDEIEKAQIEINKGRQQLEELPEASWMVLDRDMHYSTAMYDANVVQMEKISKIFPLLFFLVAALVCMTTMKRLIEEQRSQIGVFSALGFSKQAIISKYIIYALSASVLAAIVGIFVGLPIFPPVIYSCWKLMYDLPDLINGLPISAAIVGTLSFSTLMVLVTYIVTRMSLNECPAQLMRPKAPKNAKPVMLEKLHFIWNRLNFTSKVTVRNLFRYKSRFFMTVIGVAGCTSLLVLGFGLKDSINSVITKQFSEVFKFNEIVKLDDYHYTEEVIDAIEDQNKIDEIVPYMNYASKVYTEDETNSNKTISVYVVESKDADDIFGLRNRKTGEELELGNAVLVSEKFAQINNINAGDYITIESANGIKERVRVADICENYLNNYLYISSEYYDDVFGETIHYNEIGVITKDDAKINVDGIEHIESVGDFTNIISTYTSMIDALNIIVYVIILCAGSLAFVVLVNLTEVNISERIREIATLKVLGFNDKEVNQYIFKEILLLTIIGAVIGLPLGNLELGLVLNIINMDIILFVVDILPISYIYGFAITMVFAIIVLISMRKPLRNVQMVESLKSVE